MNTRHTDCSFPFMGGFIAGLCLTAIMFSSGEKIKSGKIALQAIQKCELELARKQHCKITAIPVEE